MTRGGKRTGAGRPVNSGKYKQKTKAIRLPLNEIEAIKDYLDNDKYALPFFSSAVSAGFASPAEEHQEDKLDLNQLMIKHPASTFFLRVSGTSMIKAGIHHNDILVVDRSLEIKNGKIVIAAINGELTVKRLKIEGKKIQLIPENDDYLPINITGEEELKIWGVVTFVIHAV